MTVEEFWSTLGTYQMHVVDIISTISNKTMISVANFDTGLTWWSERACEFCGMENNIQPMSENNTKLTIHPGDIEMYRSRFRNIMKGKDYEKPVEYRVRTEYGPETVLSAKCRPIFDENHVPHILVTVIDDCGISSGIDYVTGLHNSESFKTRVAEILEEQQLYSVLKVGVDKFSNINIIHGSDYASKVLRNFATMVTDMLEGDEEMYRMSGAKFGIIIPGDSKERIVYLCERIDEMVSESLFVDGKKVPLHTSYGAIVLERKYQDVNAVRSRLSFALNHSKHAHHGDLVVFNDEACYGETDNLELLSIIHECAVSGFEGFFLCYQPIVDAETGRIRGMEALLRWKKDPYGIVPPNVFIGWLEEDPCIFDLGNWIIRTALKDAKEIAKIQSDFFVNVNVSAAQIERKEFRSAILNIMSAFEYPAQNLCIELTERCRDLDFDFLRKEIEFFKQQGIKVAMDDFGTGNASLSLALSMPIDELKIDMSFIRRIQEKPENQAMVRSILMFAMNTKKETCIEGVENQEVLLHLKDYGATWHQGYYYSKPIPIEEMMELVKKKNNWNES